MSMLAEAIEAIRNMACQETATLEKQFVTAPPSEPSHVYFQRGADGLIERKVAGVEERNYTTYRMKDFVTAVLKLPSPKPAVFVGEERVTAILDETGDRRDRVVMPLTYTGQFAALKGLAAQRLCMGQDTFIDFLRIELAGCVSADVSGIFRQLKFTNNSNGESSYETGRQQISRSVLREIAAGTDEHGDPRSIPDEININLLVYEQTWGDAIKWNVACAVVIDFDKGKFTLIPLAGELNKVRLLTQNNLAEHIAVGLPDVLVVCGEV